MGNIMLITVTVSEILDHCQNLLDDPRIREKYFICNNLTFHGRFPIIPL